jgi:hypothetical protein
MSTGSTALIRRQRILRKKSFGFTLLISLKNLGTNLRETKLSLNLKLFVSNDFWGLGKVLRFLVK